MLNLLLLISDRYAQNQTPKSSFTEEDIKWILQFPPATIMHVWAHLLQQLTSHPKTIEEGAKKKILAQAQVYLSDIESQIIIAPPFLRILGAYGRYERKISRKKQAFEKQKLAFDAWLQNSVYQEASYPLCELLLLAGEINTPAYHKQAIHRYHILHNRPEGITTENQGYILFSEMLRRRANQENWVEIKNRLVPLLHTFPAHLQCVVASRIKEWSPDNSSTSI